MKGRKPIDGRLHKKLLSMKKGETLTLRSWVYKSSPHVWIHLFGLNKGLKFSTQRIKGIIKFKRIK